MPGTNTSDFAKTFVGLSREFLCVPTRGRTFESFSLGNTNDVDHFILCKGALDWNFFLKKFTGKLHLIRNGTTIDLDFHNVCLLLAPSQNGLLSMKNSTDNLAILFDLRNFFLNFFLASIIFPLETSLCKGLLLRFGPILVESTFAFNIDMLRPNCFQGSQTTWGFNIANHSDTHHRWSLKNGDSFDNLASTTFTSRTINFTDNMGHTSFEAQKGRQMAWFLSIILREGLHLTTMALGTFFGIESHGSMARCRKLTMRHVEAPH